ncbi:MAG: hypothetical protein ACFFB0_19180 [Promethearchaeota archaeon]
MKRKKWGYIVITIIIGLIITFGLFINNFIILTRIYYKINYEGDIQNFKSVIKKSELFEYQKYCKYRDYWGEVHNLSRSDSYYHIDREFIESLKVQIDEDKKKFHLFPGYQDNFIYSLEATNKSLIYLTYNNNSIIKAEHANHTEIFSADGGYYENESRFWVENWYINFTQIPFALNMAFTITLSNIILVKMNLEYNYYYNLGESESLIFTQFLAFNSNFHTMFVYIPLTSLMVQ